MEKSRLDKLLARQGFGTRKETGRLIRRGMVCVNGTVCTVPDTHIDINSDVLSVAGEAVILQREIYIMLNKRAGTVCTAKSSLYPSVFDELSDNTLCSVSDGNLHAIGRLDLDTEGLLLLTTDGVLTHRLISPKSHISKTYQITLAQAVSPEEQRMYCERIADGIIIAPDGSDGEYECRPAQLTFQDELHCTLVITEGRYHQVKRMIAACGNTVAYLRRTAIGLLQLDSFLAPGAFRHLTQKELELLV